MQSAGHSGSTGSIRPPSSPSSEGTPCPLPGSSKEPSSTSVEVSQQCPCRAHIKTPPGPNHTNPTLPSKHLGPHQDLTALTAQSLPPGTGPGKQHHLLLLAPSRGCLPGSPAPIRAGQEGRAPTCCAAAGAPRRSCPAPPAARPAQ